MKMKPATTARVELDAKLINRQLAQQAMVWIWAKRIAFWAGGAFATLALTATYEASKTAASKGFEIQGDVHDLKMEQRTLSARVDGLADAVKEFKSLPERVQQLEQSRDTLQRGQEAITANQQETLKQLAELRGFVTGQQSKGGPQK